MEPPVPALHEGATRIGAVLANAESVRLVSHDDADGLTSAAIARTALGWANVPVTTEIKHGLDDAAAGIAFEYSWHERATAADTVRGRLTGTLDAISRAGLDRGTAYTVRFNQTRAAALASDRCPGGSDRQFGPCIADSGVILQKRQDRTHVLGAAFDIKITTPGRDVRVTTAVELPSE